MIVRRMSAPFALALVPAVLALAACGSEPNDAVTDDQIIATTGPGAQIVAEPTREPPAPVDSTAATGIPVAFQGRWAQNPADCNGGPTAMTVGPAGVELPEARGTLAAVAETSPTRFHGRFNFQGEGEQWRMDELLELQGNTVVRTEYGQNGLPGPLSYQRCAA